MAQPTESITAIVLRRTKLGEADVIVTLLAEDGSQYKAVAKGARKPTSSFASRLELFSVARLLLSKGKTLDIVKEAKLIEGFAALRCDFVASAGASCVVELASKATFENQPVPRLFDLINRTLEMLATTSGNAETQPSAPTNTPFATCSAANTSSAPSSVSSSATTPNTTLVISLAALLKTLAFLGFRPSFHECVGCGGEVDLSATGTRAFSYAEGGVVCQSCAPLHETTTFSLAALRICHTLMYSTLEEASQMEIPDEALVQAFTLVHEWIKFHLGIRMRSLEFLFANIVS